MDEGGGLENRWGESPRGFESHLLRRRLSPGPAHDGEMAELVEGARLLSECGVENSTEGSNPSLSAHVAPRSRAPVFPNAPMAQLDRASVYGTEG